MLSNYITATSHELVIFQLDPTQPYTFTGYCKCCLSNPFLKIHKPNSSTELMPLKFLHINIPPPFKNLGHLPLFFYPSKIIHMPNFLSI